MYRHDEGCVNDASDRRDVADEIEIELVVERRIDRVGRSDQEERVAVCRRAHDRFGTNIAARARPVLDDEWLAQPLGQPLTHRTGDEVVSAARRDWHDQTHRPRRIGLRESEPRHARECGSTRGQMQKLSTVGKFHFEPPSHHSITSSARASGVGGTSMPRALTILWLITSSYFTLIDPTPQTTSLLDHRVVKPRISRNAISAKSCSRSRSGPSRVRGRVSSKHKVPMQLPSSSING